MKKISWDESDEDEDDEDGFCYKWMEGDSLAPYVGTPVAVLDEALTFAGLNTNDIVLDIGTGDGRIPIWAVLRGARCGIGIEIDAALARRALANGKKHGLNSDRFQIIHEDITKTDVKCITDALDSASLMVTYLLPEALRTIESILLTYLRGKKDVSTKRRLLTLGWPPSQAFKPLAICELGADVHTGTTMDAFLFDATSIISAL